MSCEQAFNHSGSLRTPDDVNAGVVNIVKNGKRIDTVSADRAHGLGADVDGSIYVSGATRMTVMKITRTR